MIETHLRAHDVCFLRDEDGDLRVDFHSDERPGVVTVWLITRGDDENTYTITGSADGVPVPLSHTQALAHCNEWDSRRCLRHPRVLGLVRARGRRRRRGARRAGLYITGTECTSSQTQVQPVSCAQPVQQ